MDSFWLKKIGCETISVFNHPSRTNNGQESINCRLKNKIGFHPGFWTFLQRLKEFTISVISDINRAGQGKRISRGKKKAEITKSSEIKNACTLLALDQITTREFLTMVSFNAIEFLFI